MSVGVLLIIKHLSYPILSQFSPERYVPFQASGVRKGREILKGEGYPSFRSVKGLKSRLTDASYAMKRTKNLPGLVFYLYEKTVHLQWLKGIQCFY